MRHGRRALAIVAVAVLAATGSCKELDVSAVDVSTVRISATVTQLLVGQSTKFSVRIEDVAGRALRREVVWTSSAPAVATVDTEGLVTALAPGTTRIRAVAEGRTDELLLTVLPPVVATVEVRPSIGALLVGDSVQLRAMARASDGTELTGRPVSWTTTDGSVASVTAGGLVRGLAIGSVTITATIEGVRGQANVSVSGQLLSVASVRIQPASTSIAVGDSVRLQAVATASDGSVIPGRRVTWTTNASTVAVVDSAGRVRAIGAGTATITATVDGVSGFSVITVVPATLSTITVTPSSTTLAFGNVVTLRATVRASDGSVVTGLRVTWTSDNPAVAPVDTAGRVTALTVGTARITAAVSGLSATATIFVVLQPVASITITPSMPALFAGDSLLVDATPKDASGSPLVNRFVVWSTGLSSIAVAIPTGPTMQQAWLFGLAAGTTTVSAASEGRTDQTTVTVLPRADLRVTMTAPTPQAAAGDTITFTLLVENRGPSAATSVVVTDTLPAVGTYVGATGSPTLAGSILTWPTVSTLVPGGSVTYTVRVVAPATGSVTNIGAAVSATAERDPTDNRSAATVTVSPADLVVKKSASAAVVNPGDTIAFTVDVSNAGPGPAATVIVTDTLPANAQFVDATGSPGQAGGVLTWQLATLAVGASARNTVRVVAPAGGAVTNVAAATSVSADANPADNRAQVTVGVSALADLAVTKTSSAAAVDGRAAIDYVIRVRNNGPSAAASVLITDTLPANATFVSATGGATRSGGVLAWPSLASLAAGDSVTILVRVTAPDSGNVVNVAAATTSTAEATPADNVSVATTAVNGADLAIVKTGPSSAAPGDTVTYSIQVTNGGPGQAALVVITDTLPSAATFIDALGGPTRTGNVLTWPTLSSLGAGTPVNYTVRVAAPAAGPLLNAAAVTAATADPDVTNNLSVVSTAVPLANLNLSKSGAASATASDTLTYAITAGNAGPDAASNVVVTDTLPLNATFESATPVAVQAGNVLTWNLASLPAGANALFTVKLSGPAGGGVVSNVAAVSSSTTDLDSSDNVSSVTTTVSPEADLAVTKSGTAQANPGAPISYTIDVTNGGPSPAATVTVIDSLPAGMVFQSASAGGTESNGVVTWQLAGLASGQGATFTVTALAPAAAGTYTNVAWAASATSDPDASNDGATAQTIITQADLNVTKTGPASVTAADTIVYTITVTNAGPSAASSVLVSDTLPSNATFIDATGGIQPSGGALTFPSISTLAAGGSASFTVRLMGPRAGGSVTNTAAATSPTNDPTLPNVTSITTAVSPAANLQVSKSASATTASAADTVAYTITMTNLGPSDATAVAVTDTLPSNGTLVDATPGAAVSGRALTWSAGTVPAGGSATYNARVVAGPAGTVTNVATTTSPTADPDATNNVTSVNTAVATVDLDVAVSGPAAITAGDTIAYTITVGNKGPGRALGVTVQDQLPANAAFVDATGAYTRNGSVLQWTEPRLESGGALVYTVRVIAPISGSVQNSASAATSSQDTDSNNNAGAAVTAVNPAPADVQLQISATSGSVVAGDTITYTIGVTNTGPGTAIGVVATQSLPSPSDITFRSATGNPLISGQTLTWAAVDIAPGAVVTYVVKVTADRAATVTSTATATSATSPDPNPANNSASASTIIS